MIVSVPALMGAFDVGAPDEAATDEAALEEVATAEGAVPDDEAAEAVAELADEGAAVFFAFDVQAANAAEPATMPAPLRKERLLTCV